MATPGPGSDHHGRVRHSGHSIHNRSVPLITPRANPPQGSSQTPVATSARSCFSGNHVRVSSSRPPSAILLPCLVVSAASRECWFSFRAWHCPLASRQAGSCQTDRQTLPRARCCNPLLDELKLAGMLMLAGLVQACRSAPTVPKQLGTDDR